MVSGHQEPAFTVASLATIDHADAGDHPGTGRLPIVLVVGHEQAELEPGCVRIEQFRHPLARRQLPLLVHLGDTRRAAPRAQALGELPVFVGERPKAAYRSRCSDAHEVM